MGVDLPCCFCMLLQNQNRPQLGKNPLLRAVIVYFVLSAELPSDAACSLAAFSFFKLGRMTRNAVTPHATVKMTSVCTICLVFPLSFASSVDSAAVVCGAVVSAAAAGTVSRLPARSSTPNRLQSTCFQRRCIPLAQRGRNGGRRHGGTSVFQISIILDRLYVVVHIDTSTSRNQLTNNNVFF